MIEIPGYKIHRALDSSDYCQSYSAIQLSTGKTMVVSIFNHSATQYESFKSFFNDIEQKIANKSFGVITPIKEFIKTQNHTYIISDLLSNSCQQVYKERQTDIDTLFNHIYKIALSLDLYHQVGFYHGGISLDNIFHDTDSALTLGLPAFNQNFSTEEKAQFNQHKESYKAPEKEIAQSKSRDFYALGVVLYELIFKQKPFIADNQKQLEQLKKAGVIKIPDPSFDPLKTIFSALLNPDPNHRVSNANDLKSLALEAGIKIDNTHLHVESLITAQIQPSTDNERKEQKGLPKYVYYLASIVLVALIIPFVYKTSSQEAPQQIEPNSEDLIENIADNTPLNNKTSNSTEFEQLIISAQNALNNHETASSLLLINQALKIFPSNENALNIKQSIEKELKVKAIIQQANQQILGGNIIGPPNNNAIDTYHKLQEILPKDDTRAQDGIKKISSAYHRLALKQYKLNNKELARSILAEGLTAIPNDKLLQQLDQSFKNDRKVEQQKLLAEAQRQNRQRALEIQQLKETENAKEAQRLVLLEQKNQRALEEQRQKRQLENFKIQKEKQRQQQIINLYNEAQRSLIDTQLTLNTIDNAIDNLQSLEFLSVDPERSNQLRKDIDNAYRSLSEYQVSVQQYQQAGNTIRKGLTTNPNNQALISLQVNLNTLLATQKEETDKKSQEQIKNVEIEKEEEKELPIFGTF